jgi:hypothetical protein
MATYVKQYLLVIRTDGTTLHVLGDEHSEWRWSSAIVDLRDDGATTRSGNTYVFGTRIDDIDAVDKNFLAQVVERDGPLLIAPASIQKSDLEAFVVVGRAHAAARDIAFANAKAWPKRMRVLPKK